MYKPFIVTSILDVRIGEESVAVFTRHSYLPFAPLIAITVRMLCATHNPEYEKTSSDISESTLRYSYSTENNKNVYLILQHSYKREDMFVK